MNKERRKKLKRLSEKISEIIEILEEVMEEEREAYENSPDNFKYGERGEEMDGYIELLDEAYDYLDDAKHSIDLIGDHEV